MTPWPVVLLSRNQFKAVYSQWLKAQSTEDWVILNVYACNNKASKYVKLKLTDLKEETDISQS